MAGITYLSGLNLIVLILYCPVNYGEQLTFSGEEGSDGCFYPGERVLLICSHIPWYSAVLWSYSPVNTPTYIETSGLPSVRTVTNETNLTVHTVEITSAEKALDGNSLWCGIDTGNHIIKSNTVTFHIAPGNEQNWTLLSVMPHGTSHMASFLLMQITFTSHQICANKRAMISVVTEAFNVSSNTTLQEQDKMPLVNKVTKTLLNVTNLLRCVRYRHRVRVVYPGLGETEQKVYEDTSMLRPGLPLIDFTKLSASVGIVTIKTTAAKCHPKESPAYRVTLGEATPTAILTMLWHWPGVRDSSSSNHTDQTWTYQGDIPHGQEEMAWLLGFTSVTNSSRDTKLRITATFVNTLGEATQTDEFDIALDALSEAPSYDTQDEVSLQVGLALYVAAPLLSTLTAASLVTACILAVKLHRAKRKETGTHTDMKPPIYETCAVTTTMRPETVDPAAAATANQANPSYIPLEQLMMSQTMQQQGRL